MTNPFDFNLIQSQVDKERNRLTDSQVILLRKTAKSNLYFLATAVLDYKDLNQNLHGHLCRWIDETRNDLYRLFLLPRFHFKTTIVTITDTIRLILPDDTGTLPYPYNLGPDIRIGIFHEAGEHAADFLRSITNHVLGNPKLLALYPEIKPGASQVTNVGQLEIPRQSFWSESTIEAYGIKTKIQGKHFNVLKVDDIYGTAARDSPAEHLRAVNWIQGVLSLTTNINTDRIDFAGTRYKHDDVYSYIYRDYKSRNLKVYHKSVWEQDSNGNDLVDEKGHKIPIFPERISWEAMQPIMANKSNYESNYLNDPSRGKAEIDSDYIQYFKELEWNKYQLETPEGDIITYHLEELDRIMLVDPAPKGLSGITITGTTNKKDYQILVLEAIEQSFGTEELLDKIFQLAGKYRVRVVAIEEVNFSILYQYIINTEFKRRRLRFKIEGVRTRARSKEDRVRGLIPYMANRRIYFNPKHTAFLKTVQRFPGIDDYHALDSLAYGPIYWKRSPGYDTKDNIDRVTAMFAARDPVTGYSKFDG